MSNAYSVPNRFFLNIASVDYQIREPLNWNAVRTEMSRDINNFRFGFTDILIEMDVQVSFTQEPSVTGVRSFDLLRDLVNNEGTDAIAIFRLERESDPINNPGVWDVMYAANVDFNPKNFQIVDRQINATLRTVSFEDKINSRRKTLIDINSNVDLDGNVGTNYVPTNIKLHSKAIKVISGGIVQGLPFPNSSTPILEEDLNEVRYENGDQGFLPSPFLNPVVNPQTSRRVFGGTLLAPSESRNYKYTILTESTIRLFVLLNPPLTAELFLSETNGATVTRTSLGTQLFNITPIDFVVSSSLSFSKEKEDEDSTTYNLELDITDVSGGSIASVSPIDVTFRIVVDSLSPESLVDVWTLGQVGSRLIEASTGIDAYQSDIIDGGCAEFIGFTNGRFLKKQTEAEFNPKTSIDEFLNSMGGMFGMGYGFEGGTFRHEPIEHFFTDVEVLVIPNVSLESYSEEFFSDMFFNTAKVGYRKGFDTDSFFLDDPHAEHQYLLPIIRPEQEKDFRADYIPSMYAIERKRREQFIRQSDSNRYDDDGFLIKLDIITEYDSNNYQYRPNEIQLLGGEYFNVDPGESITIVGGPIAGVYTVGDISKEEDNTFLQNLAPAIVATGSFNGPFTLELGSAKIVPERDENFTSVSGLNRPETSYNLLLTPKRLLLNQSLWINSILNFKPGTDIIRNQFVKNNGVLTTEANNNASTCNDPDRLTYTENADIAIEDLNQGNKLFTGRVITLTANIGYDNIQLLQNANTQVLTGGQAGLNGGYVTFDTTNGFQRSGWIYDMRFALNMEIVELIILEKA